MITKDLSKMDLAEWRKSQKGLFRIITDKKPIELKTITIPTYDGDQLIIEIVKIDNKKLNNNLKIEICDD